MELGLVRRTVYHDARRAVRVERGLQLLEMVARHRVAARAHAHDGH